MNNAFSHLKTFKNFEDMVSDDYYLNAPQDWTVVLTDIKGSTRAIQNGKYKSVNMVGVMAIVTVQNICEGIRIPAVFGGDGATILVPNDCVSKLEEPLKRCQLKASEEFDLDLRVALIPVKVLIEQGSVLQVACQQLEGDSLSYMMRGDGLLLAEKLAKQSEEYHLNSEVSPGELAVEGLSCRWNPIPSQQGQILTLIIKNQSRDVKVYKEFIGFLRSIQVDLQLVNPDKLSTHYPPKHLYYEVKATTVGWLRGLKYFSLLFLVGLITLAVRSQKKNPQSAVYKYMSDLSKNTDHIKLEELLKMVLDVNSSQQNQIIKYLENQEQSGAISFGYFNSSEALMTCFVKNQQNHIHFIDGGDGGYAMAARMLKEKAVQKS